MPSLWAQSVRDDAQTEPFEPWLRRFFGEDHDHPIADRYRRGYQQDQLVERWAELVGPERVTVIIADSSRPALLTNSFEAMLGLPADALAWSERNRSLTADETELLRHANIELRERGADWRTFYTLVRKGAVQLGPERRVPPPDARRVVLPPWAAEIADADGRAFATELADSPVRVVGDLDILAAPSLRAEWQPVDNVPIDVGSDALAAAVLSGQESRLRFVRDAKVLSGKLRTAQAELAASEKRSLADFRAAISPGERAAELAGAFTSRELAAALKRRLLRRLRRLRTRLLHRR